MTAPASPYGRTYPETIDLSVLRRAHRSLYEEQTLEAMDGNTVASIASLQFWRSPIYAGFPITPSTKWLESIADHIHKGKFVTQIGDRRVSVKRLKLLESEHAVADYMVGVAAACRDLIVQTATSSVGLDHMTETVRSLGASGLGNVMLINVYRATANYPLCIEGDPSDTLAHRDDGWIQVSCRGKQQIYDTLIQLPCVGMHPDVLVPTMPGFYGIKDSHRIEQVRIEPDRKIHEFQDDLIPDHSSVPGLINGDTSMGNCVTSAHFQGFKVGQWERLTRVRTVMDHVARKFEEAFGRPGLQPLEIINFDQSPRHVVVTMGPDAGTAESIIMAGNDAGAPPVGLIAVRLLTPFPLDELRRTLAGVERVGVVNNAFHPDRGHLTALVAQALSGTPTQVIPIFAGIGGADVSQATWRQVMHTTLEGSHDRTYFLHAGEVIKEMRHGNI